MTKFKDNSTRLFVNLKIFTVLLTLLVSFAGVCFASGNPITLQSTTGNKIKFTADLRDRYTLKDTIVDGVAYQIVRTSDPCLSKSGDPWLPSLYNTIAVPFGATPVLTIERAEEIEVDNILMMPFPQPEIEQKLPVLEQMNRSVYAANAFFPAEQVRIDPSYRMRFAKIAPVIINPFRYNPVTRKLKILKSVTVTITFNQTDTPGKLYLPVKDRMTDDFIKTSVLNYEQGKQWVMEEKKITSDNPAGNYWYVPGRNYYKMYLKNQGIYKLTFNELVAAGVPLGSGVSSRKIDIINQEKFVPLDVQDGGDSVFGPGDYIRFMGKAPDASPYVKQNLYNLSNIYWFTYQADSSKSRYAVKDGTPTPTSFQNVLSGYYRTDFYEKDSLYERLGYAPDGQRDYWFWAKASAIDSNILQRFDARFNAFKNFNLNYPVVRVRVAMHGMTNFGCFYDHKAMIFVNGKNIGTAQWNGQDYFLFEKSFYVGPDSVPLYPDGNSLQVVVDGKICHSSKSDEIRINWFDFTYYSDLRVGPQHATTFTNSENFFGRNLYWTYGWSLDSTVQVFIPSKGILYNRVSVLKDALKSVQFIDTVEAGEQTEYFCVNDSGYLKIDSIISDRGSDLRNTANGADYIIIYHRKFESVAQRLKTLRQTNFPDTSITNPRIVLAEVQEIYDEFNGGLLDPYAIQRFVKYAFENWTNPKPAYVVILGDMSYDYRQLLASSRPNYVPSIPHHSYTYGIAASDNGIVSVVGDDIIPDLAVGRISIETIEEGNILLNKLETYPTDNSKDWKENVLLMASGLNQEDEASFGFNDKSLLLRDLYINPAGANSTLIFRYPDKPEHIPFQGSTAQIRAAFDKGAIIANYYGHGGGYQWDATFLNEDIYQLRNEGRLPLVVSVTCYTAHFDNQDVFGEQFFKVPGKGAIGFFGSSGLTHWQIGEFINQIIFKEIFLHKTYVTGKTFLIAKGQVPLYTYYINQVALLTYLGDPVMKLALPELPDFNVKSSDITLSPEIPVIGDSVTITVRANNLGPMPSDSILVDLKFTSADTSGTIGVKRLRPFGNRDSISFNWKPRLGGLYQLQVTLNDDAHIIEGDFTDNKATTSVGVFNLDEPSVVQPRDGLQVNSNIVKFKFADIGHYLNKSLTYFVEVDTTREFTNPLVKSPAIIPGEGFAEWNSPALPKDNYFWRARTYDGTNYGKWTALRKVTVSDTAKAGFNLSGRLLSTLENDNLFVNNNNGGLLLNTNVNPPKPQRSRLIEDILIDSARFYYKFGLSTITTDGTYMYIGNMFYFQAVYFNDSTGTSPIYRFGTGYNGTVKGQLYDSIPGFKKRIAEMITCHGDGFIYAPYGNPYRIMKIHPVTGNVDTVAVPAGLIDKFAGRPVEGSFYIQSDSQYIYNLALRDSNGAKYYSLRVFDPADNFRLVFSKVYETVVPYNGFCSFFVYKGFIYPFEDETASLMRRMRISDGVYEQEWNAWEDPRPELYFKHYGWTYDWRNDVVYASIWKWNYFVWKPGFSKFKGTYVDASGRFTTPALGPVAKWDKVNYSVIPGSPASRYSLAIEGFNKNKRKWDTLAVNIPAGYSLSRVGIDTISQIRVKGLFTDTSLTTTTPFGLKSLGVQFSDLPDLVVTKNNLSVSPDSALQGIPFTVNAGIYNGGGSAIDSFSVLVSLDGRDTVLHNQSFGRLPADSTARFSFSFRTEDLLFQHSLKFVLKTAATELFTFNNIVSKTFFVARDTVNPKFKITFDGKEILNGDVVSKNPQIYVSLEDDGPMPLDTTMFTLIFDNVSLGFKKDSLQFNYIPYPASKAEVLWKPLLKKGRHTLDILAKDASGNFFDTTYNRTIFNIFEDNDIAYIYNYPNPFKGGTSFTFELRGKEKPESIEIKIFTVAGRLIKRLNFPSSQLNFNFNKMYWDGRDEDGNDIANGVYFYRIITKYPAKTLPSIQKLVKMR